MAVGPELSTLRKVTRANRKSCPAFPSQRGLEPNLGADFSIGQALDGRAGERVEETNFSRHK